MTKLNIKIFDNKDVTIKVNYEAIFNNDVVDDIQGRFETSKITFVAPGFSISYYRYRQLWPLIRIVNIK